MNIQSVFYGKFVLLLFFFSASLRLCAIYTIFFPNGKFFPMGNMIIVILDTACCYSLIFSRRAAESLRKILLCKIIFSFCF